MEIDSDMKVSIQETLEGFKVTTDIFGEMTSRLVNVRAAIEEQATRDALIRMGWTPPERRAEDEDLWLESWWRLTPEGPVYERKSLNSAPQWVGDFIRRHSAPVDTTNPAEAGSASQRA